MLSDAWNTGQTGHTAEHNKIARRLNRGVYVETLTGDAIQSVVDSMVNVGGVIYLLPKIYAVSRPLILTWNVELAGAGKFLTTLQATAPMASVVKIAGANHLRGFGVVGDNLPDAGIDCDHSANNVVEEVRVENCLNYGLYIHGGSWVNQARNCIFKRCLHGIYVVGSADAQANFNSFEHCIVGNNRGAGIRLSGGTSTLIERCNLEQNQGGIWQSGGGGSLSIVRNHLESNGEAANPNVGIRIGDAVRVNYASMITGNYIFGGSLEESNYGVQIENTVAANIQSNRTWGHLLGSLNYVGAQNVSPVAQANVFQEPIIGSAG